MKSSKEVKLNKADKDTLHVSNSNDYNMKYI